MLSHSRNICRSKASSCDRDSRSIPELLFGITVCQPSPSSAMAAKSGGDRGALGNRWRISDELAKITVRSDEGVGSGYHPQETNKPWSLRRRRRKEKRYLLRHNPSPSTRIEEIKENSRQDIEKSCWGQSRKSTAPLEIAAEPTSEAGKSGLGATFCRPLIDGICDERSTAKLFHLHIHQV